MFTRVASPPAATGTRQWGTLIAAASLVGCSAANRPAELDYDAADSLRAEARELERSGRCEDALELYLQCFNACPAAARQVGPDLRRLSRQCPSGEAPVWQAVEVAETEVASEPISEAELTGRVFALLSVYQSWDRPERAEALQARLKRSLSLRSYHEALKVLAAAAPTGLHSLDENDAALLLIDVLEAPLYEGVMIRLGELGVESSNDLERGRVSSAVGYTAALLQSNLDTWARRILQAVLEGVGEPRCRKLLHIARKRELEEVASAVCEVCKDAPECRPPG
jgi:hypothetical protein